MRCASGRPGAPCRRWETSRSRTAVREEVGRESGCAWAAGRGRGQQRGRIRPVVATTGVVPAGRRPSGFSRGEVWLGRAGRRPCATLRTPRRGSQPAQGVPPPLGDTKIDESSDPYSHGGANQYSGRRTRPSGSAARVQPLRLPGGRHRREHHVELAVRPVTAGRGRSPCPTPWRGGRRAEALRRTPNRVGCHVASRTDSHRSPLGSTVAAPADAIRIGMCTNRPCQRPTTISVARHRGVDGRVREPQAVDAVVGFAGTLRIE